MHAVYISAHALVYNPSVLTTRMTPVTLRFIDDWDDAYNNLGHIPSGQDFPRQWQERAASFRQRFTCELDIAYGVESRERYDLFKPNINASPRGVMVFIHGGYWMKFDKSYWSFLAKGYLDQNWAVAIPSYTLCPDATIATIETQVAKAVEHVAASIDGPIVLTGHSAGGQLVTSMICTDTQLSAAITKRIQYVLSISGVHDLRSLLHTKLNEFLNLDWNTASNCSPALKQPITDIPVGILVGEAERPEFLRQSALLANVWHGLGAKTQLKELHARHHFDVIDSLCDISDGVAAPILE